LEKKRNDHTHQFFEINLQIKTDLILKIIICIYLDPFFTYSSAYEKWPIVENCTRYCHTVFITLHGSKEHETSAALLTRLKKNAGKPTLQTLGMGGMKYINDTSVTCCYPDSKPSPIHPLLCEHPPPV